MACVYYYKGHKFDSELLLDTFLLTKEKYYSKYGDQVFSAETSHFEQVDKLEKNIANNTTLYNEYKELLRRGDMLTDPDGDPYIRDGANYFRYTGATKFLGGHKKRHKDEYYYPYFIEKEYFDRRIEDWAQGNFNDTEKEVLFNNDPNAIHKIDTQQEIDISINKLKFKWKSQGRAGDGIHEVLQHFFSDENGTPIRDMPDDLQVSTIMTRILAGNNAAPLFHNGSVENNVREAIQIARKLYEDIKNSLPEGDITFFPEYLIKGTGANSNGKQYDIFGKIDLLVVDSTGQLHIYDYKTSTKTYDDFNPTKRTAYNYQLALYTQMLENLGININNADLYIVPVQLKNFSLAGDKYEFDSLEYGGIQEITNVANMETARQEIEYIMPSKYAFHISNEDANTKVVEFIKKVAPDVPISKVIDEKSTETYLNNRKVFDSKNDKGKYEFNMFTSGQKAVKIETDTKEEMIQLVMQERKNAIPTRHRLMEQTIKALEKGIKYETTNVSFPKTFSRAQGSSTWIKDTFSPYCNKEWEIIRNGTLEQFDIITLHNINTDETHFLGISTNPLFENIMEKKFNRKSILAAFETDAQAEQKYKRFTLPGVMGNLELIQMMEAINCVEGVNNKMNIGRLMVVNPYDAEMATASNEELLMNYNALKKYVPGENNFDNGNLTLLDYYHQVYNMLADIWASGERSQWKSLDLKDYFDGINSSKSMIDQNVDGTNEQKIEALQSLLRQLTANMDRDNDLRKDYTDQAKLQSRKIRLYNTVLFALAELRGIHFRQQYQDHYKWFSSIYKTLKEGQSGNYTDNPGNLDSETLNLITTLVKEANQNIRDDIQKEKPKLDAIIRKLKSDIGFSYLKENIGFNQADLYKPLYNSSIKDDLVFNRVEDVPVEYRPLLEYMLENINKRRHAGKSQAMRDHMRDTYDPEYYRVPLARGGFDSEVSARGLFRMLVSKLKYLNPMNWRELYDIQMQKVQGLGIREKIAENKKNADLIYELENYFDRGETDREAAIKSAGGINNVERNAQVLMLKYLFAYSQKEHIDRVFPMIQAAGAHLSIQGANVDKVFTSDKKYFEDYIRSKIKKESIVSPELEGIHAVLTTIKQAASKMTLSFTPVQMLYQPLQGLWQDISLMIRKPDGKNSFTFQHFRTAIKLLFTDLIDVSGKPTLCSLINELYALNDMDINKYVENISKSKKGLIYNWGGMAFKFASRPDYYNRLAIFLCQMQGDGCLEAHSVVNGKLKYDWTKDKRFSKFATNPKDKNNRDPEYIRQRALYHAIASQLVAENARDENGDPFVLDMNDPKPLPRAYTSKQAEGHKSLSDDIYGYYSEENKSLIQATALGSLWLQFKTYWSGKKNQYLQSGAVRMRGSWEPYTEVEKDVNGNIVLDENGKPKIIEYYYDVNPDGSINYQKIVRKQDLSPDKQIAPVIYWKGQWQEGIAVTLSKLCNDRHIFRNYHKLMAEDSDMARCYKNNIQQLGYDMFMFLVGGVIIGGLLAKWLKELLKDNKDNKDFLTGCELAAANVAVWTVKNSFLDFNFFDSIGSPITQWTPFAAQFTFNSVKNLSKLAMGEQDMWDTMVRMNGWSKQAKPIFDALKPEMFRTKQEGGTWESRTAINNRENNA